MTGVSGKQMASFVSPAGLIFVYWCLAGSLVWGQTRDLREDLHDLNVRHRTAHYALAGTVSDEQLQEFGRCLEYIHAEYVRGFAGLLQETRAGASGDIGRNDAEADSARFSVVILATREQYEEFRRAYFSGASEHTSGLYVPSARLLLISAAGEADRAYEVIFHEAFHQFADRHIPLMPIWVNEGLATYYGTARPTPRGLEFVYPRRDLYHLVRDAASAKQLIPFDELLYFDQSAFYRQDAVPGVGFTRKPLCYAQAYSLCAYMLSDSAGREHLQEYLRALARARSPKQARQATAESFPPQLLKSLVPAWLEMVNRR